MTNIPSAMNRAGLFFIGDIQEQFYSGRKSDDTGLNVRTGRLRSSWFPMVLTQGSDTVLQVNTDVKYARVHEDGSFKNNLPARTNVIVEWETSGKKLIEEELRAAMR